jgi:hypothetical protein
VDINSWSTAANFERAAVSCRREKKHHQRIKHCKTIQRDPKKAGALGALAGDSKMAQS